MKSFKMLTMAVLTILSVSVFARTSKKYEARPSILKSEKLTYTCPVHAWIVLDKAGMCPECGTALNLSLKEKMKLGVMQKYNMCNSTKPVSNLNLSSKEEMKRDAVKINSYPADPFVTSNKAFGYPECCTGLKELNMPVTCPMMAFSTGNQAKLNLSPKEKMKRGIM